MEGAGGGGCHRQVPAQEESWGLRKQGSEVRERGGQCLWSPSQCLSPPPRADLGILLAPRPEVGRGASLTQGSRRALRCVSEASSRFLGVRVGVAGPLPRQEWVGLDLDLGARSSLLLECVLLPAVTPRPRPPRPCWLSWVMASGPLPSPHLLPHLSPELCLPHLTHSPVRLPGRPTCPAPVPRYPAGRATPSLAMHWTSSLPGPTQNVFRCATTGTPLICHLLLRLLSCSLFCGSDVHSPSAAGTQGHLSTHLWPPPSSAQGLPVAVPSVVRSSSYPSLCTPGTYRCPFCGSRVALAPCPGGLPVPCLASHGLTV